MQLRSATCGLTKVNRSTIIESALGAFTHHSRNWGRLTGKYFHDLRRCDFQVLKKTDRPTATESALGALHRKAGEHEADGAAGKEHDTHRTAVSQLYSS